MVQVADFGRLIWSFLVRDFYTQLSYRVAFFLSFFGIFFRAFTFFFISRLIGNGADEALSGYSGDYFSFVLLGLAFNSYFGVGLNSFGTALRDAQTTGTLEAMLMTPTPVSAIIVGSAVWNYAFTTLQVLFYLGLGIWLGVDLSNANIALAILTLLISIVAFASIGIIAASIIMVIKRGNPVTAIIGSVSSLLGGIYYPIELLPEWLQIISYLLPITYSLDVMRQALLNGATLAQVSFNLTILIVYCLILFPVSLFCFRLAVNKARADGSLAQY